MSTANQDLYLARLMSNKIMQLRRTAEGYREGSKAVSATAEKLEEMTKEFSKRMVAMIKPLPIIDLLEPVPGVPRHKVSVYFQWISEKVEEIPPIPDEVDLHTGLNLLEEMILSAYFYHTAKSVALSLADKLEKEADRLLLKLSELVDPETLEKFLTSVPNKTSGFLYCIVTVDGMNLDEFLLNFREECYKRAFQLKYLPEEYETNKTPPPKNRPLRPN